MAKDSNEGGKFMVDEICCADVDLDGKKSIVCGYIIDGLVHDIILGEPWMRHNDVVYQSRERVLFLKSENHYIRTHDSSVPKIDVAMVRHTAMSAYLKRARQQNQGENRDTLSSRWFTKIDVSAAFHRIRVKGDEWKTAFQTRLGKFEWLVMPFGLTGAPAAWQMWINDLLRDYLDHFCTAYLDDVLIWSDGSKEDHLEKVNKVLEKLTKAGLKLDLKKCDFAVKRIKYLGFIVTVDKGISVDPEKVEAVKKWELPRTQTGVRSFLGFANFYLDFIADFSSLSAPLQRYTMKEFSSKGNIQLDNEARQAFEKLKQHFIIALHHSAYSGTF
ncbi:hypothetical protein K3495_g13666 [Podosphaera aphanis]|nr:hypothetical protein K3495_g13666 [Podosphaera aphanis]